MAKHKGRRFRLKNIKRLLCCCCPFRKKRYSLEQCNDGEDDLRGRFTPTWRVTNIALSNSVDEGLYGEDASTVSHRKPDERDEGQSIPLEVTCAMQRDALLQETDVARENVSLQVIEAQRCENYSFQIIQSHIPEHASIQTATIPQQWGEVAFQILLDHACGPLPHTAICILQANNETMVFQNRMNCTKLLHRRQGDVYSHGRSVLVLFLHLLYQGTYYNERKIQTFRNHCLIKYQLIFVPTYPDIFYLILGSAIYTITGRSLSFQMLESIEYSARRYGNAGGVNDGNIANAGDDNMSDAGDDERDDYDVNQKHTDGSTCENKADNSGSFSSIAGNNTITTKELTFVNNLDLQIFQNKLTKNNGQRKSGPKKNRNIPKYCESELHMQDSNNRTPARIKQNGRVHVKATLSAASDPPPGYLKQQKQRLFWYCIAERSMLKSPPVLSIWSIRHPYIQSTSSLNLHKCRRCVHNNYQSIRSLCNDHCIVAILSVGFIILVYFVHYLTC